jgi:DNA-directed RNA polymerase subunit RPC12/RpoP
MNMQRSLSSLRLGEEDHTCDECGKPFQRAIVATLSSSGQVQTYYACPRCLAEVEESKRQRSEEDEEEPVLMKSLKKVKMRLEDNASCDHFLGYLKQRPRDTPIPEGCLTCGKMVECLIK